MPEGAIVRVVLVPAPGRLAPLDYHAPQLLAPGTRVLVPLGTRRAMGVVSGPGGETAGMVLREIIAVLDDAPVLDASMMQLATWMAGYYLATLAEVLGTALPGALRIETERRAEIVETPPQDLPGAQRDVVALLADRTRNTDEIAERLGERGRRALAALQRRGVVIVHERLRREVAPTRRQRFYEAVSNGAASELLQRRPALRALHAYLTAHPFGRAPDHELRHSFTDATAKLRALERAGLVRAREEEQYRSVLPPIAARDTVVALTPAQTVAVDAITAPGDGFVAWLLHGVTGSGKTEVYLRAIAALPAHASALVLVPEISLTHQLVERVRARFGEAVAVLHSQLSVGERWDEWRRIARGAARIVVGARSAVFAPLRNLGLIIVDEEHDTSYKEAEGVRYHGRDVAVMRAKLSGCPIILGSATPSMESLANAQRGRYRLLALPERVAARPLPPVRLIDLRSRDGAAPPILTPEMLAALAANLADGGQSLLFLNRRGFANFLQCRACGEPRMCPNCSVALTVHRRWRALRCHYCDYTIPPPTICGECGEPALREWGIGTEQLEHLLRARFPSARVARMDRDSTRRKGSQQKLLADWRAGHFDILIGTQMITKGHDVPGVTLVGVVHADAALNFPDFRAAERTFQLLAQVAGRAGRGERPGRVIVQTLQPDHYSLRAAVQHDFATFAAQELATRQELGYPPFARLVLLRFEGADQAAVETAARDAARLLRERAAGRFTVLGPAPAALERIRQRHRIQLLLRAADGSTIRSDLNIVLPTLRNGLRGRAIRLIADVDPQHML